MGKRFFVFVIVSLLNISILSADLGYSAAPSGSDYAYDKESSSSNNKIFVNSQVIPAASTDPLTVETWVNIESFTGDWMAIFTQNQSDSVLTNRLWFGINGGISGGARIFHIGTSVATTDSPSLDSVLTVGNWAHIALTLNSDASNNAKIYVNGTLFHQATLARGTTTNERGFAIGTNTAGTHRFDGKFDNFKVWNTALTQTQIRESRYAYGSEGVSGAPSLRAFYDFDESTGSTVNDRTGSGYSLTISATTTPVADGFISSSRQKAISYDTQGATTTYSGGSTTFFNDSTISQIPTTAPLKTNFTFAGWFTSASGGTQITNGSAMPNTREATITLYAQWTDSLAPTYSSSAVASSGSSLSLTYSETLSATTAAAARFTISRSFIGLGTETITISSVAASAAVVTLTLSSTIYVGDTITVSYSDPTAGDDANAIQDSAGNDAISITNQSVTNNSTQKRSQATLTLSSASLAYGSTLRLAATGGSGSGGITYAVTSGSCSITNTDSLTASTTGSCLVTATKAADSNYLVTTSSSATITITATASSATITVAVGNLYYRSTKSISAVASVAGKLTFRANNTIIAGCKNLAANAGNSYTRSCSYRPSSRGYVTIAVTLVPTDTSYTSSIVSSDRYFVYQRSGSR